MVLAGLLSASTAGAAGETLPVGLVQYVDVDTTSVHVTDLSLKQGGKPHEFTLPTLPVAQSQAAAKAIDDAWQRYEDRVRWRFQMQANASLLPVPALPSLPHDHWATTCVVPLGEISNTLQKSLYGAKDVGQGDPPAFSVSNDGLYSRPGFTLPDGMTFEIKPDAALLPWYGEPVDLVQFQRVPTASFCDGVQMRTAVDGTYPLDPQATYGAAVNTPVGQLFQLQFNQTEIDARLKLACTDVTAYYQDYLKEIGDAIKLVPGGLLWSDVNPASGTAGKYMGLYVTAATDLNGSSVQKLQEIIRKVGDPRAGSYYGDGRPKLTDTTSPLEPGFMPLEELKRFLPVTNPIEQSRLGVANLFMVWADFDVVRDPKLLTLHTVNYYCDIWGCAPLPGLPVPINSVAVGPGACTAVPGVVSWPPNPSTLGQIVFALPRFHYRWLSVPEGYAVPYVSGDPVGLNSGSGSGSSRTVPGSGR